MKKAKENIRKLYPLMPGQRLIWSADQIYYIKSSSNIATSMTFDSEIDPKKMLEAMQIELSRNDVAHIRLHKVRREVCFYLSEMPPEGVELVDLSALTQEAFDDYIAKLSKTPFPNKRLDTQLYNVFLAKCPNGKYMLYFLAHHIIMDTYGIFLVASNILQIYTALVNGGEIPPCKSELLKLYERDMAESEEKSYRHERSLAFWSEKELITEPLYTSVNGSASTRGEFIRGKRYGKSTQLVKIKGKQINLLIPAPLVQRIDDFAAQHHISAQVLFLLGVRSHMSRENGFASDVSVYNSIAKRATLLEKRCAITRADVLLYRMNLPNDMSVLEACKYLNAHQLELYKHDISVFEMTALYKERFGTPALKDYPGLYMTYQKYGVAIPEGMSWHVQRYESGVSAMPLSILIVDADGSGSLLCNYEYNTAMVNVKSVMALHEHLLFFLETAVDNPQMSLEAIMKSQALSLS